MNSRNNVYLHGTARFSLRGEGAKDKGEKRSAAWRRKPAHVAGLMALASLWLGITSPLCFAQAAKGSAQAQGAATQIRLVSVTSGSKSSEKDGKFTIEDPRTTFTVPDDKQVIVYFVWEGPVGPHHLQAVWKDPDGKAVSLADMDYKATASPFGAYFGLRLDANVTPGVWTVEAKCDGQPAGSTSFQVNSNLKPTPAPAKPPLLSTGDAYKLAMASTATVEKLDSSGQVFAQGSAFFVGRDLLATTFGAIDGASSLRVLLPDQKPIPLKGVVSWSRREDWAVLRVAPQSVPPLKMAAAGSAQVGDTCFSLDRSPQGSQTITEGVVTGDAQLPDVGERLNVDFTVQSGASGSPVLNEHGAVIGILEPGVLLPGADAIETTHAGGPFAMFPVLKNSGVGVNGAAAVPASLVRLPGPAETAITLQGLAAQGQITPLLEGRHSVWRGFMAKGIQRIGEMPLPIEEKYRFSHLDKRAEIMVEWDATTSLKFQASMELYDLDNRRLGGSKLTKVSAHAGHKAAPAWTIDVATMPEGIYRVDVLEDSDVVWRAFFRVEN
jgi:S1-C subfamily serine protease